MENAPLYSLPLVLMSVLEEILSFSDCEDICRGQMLEQLEELLQMIHLSMNFSSILVDRII